MKKCECGYLIDVVVDGETIRPATFRQEGVMYVKGQWWNQDKPVTDDAEAARLDAARPSAEVVNPHWYDDHSVYTKSVFYTMSISDIPVDSKNIVINWDSDTTEGILTFTSKKLLNGDDMYIVIKNPTENKKKISIPLPDQGYETVAVWSDNLEIDPDSTVAISVSYMGDKWYFDMKSRGTAPYVSTFVIQNGLYIMSGVWTSDGVWQFEPTIN